MSDVEKCGEPMVPPEVDLTDFAYLPLDAVRLRDSDLATVTSGDEFRAAVILWCAAWHQLPAASLPNDDRLLAKLSGYGRDVAAWQEVREGALHGFELCADGRLYHPVLADKAIEVWARRKKDARRTEKATAARLAKLRRDDGADARRDVEGDNDRDVSRDVQRDIDRDVDRSEHQGKGEEEKGSEPPLPPQGDAEQLDPIETDFAELWGAHPRKEAMPQGLSTYRQHRAGKKVTGAKRKNPPVAHAVIMAAHRVSLAEWERRRTPVELIPRPSSWLNQEPWKNAPHRADSVHGRPGNSTSAADIKAEFVAAMQGGGGDQDRRDQGGGRGDPLELHLGADGRFG